MPRQFEVRYEGELPAIPAQAWEAITARTAGWWWPIQHEPRRGGSESGLVGAWGMPAGPGHHRFAAGVEREKTERARQGWLNELFEEAQ